jgi:hypothetical protein
MVIRGQQLIYYNDGSAPGIIRVFQSWVRDHLREGANWRDLITKPATGVTRVLPFYWDDWWNYPNVVRTNQYPTWYDRFEIGDYRGVLDYSAQVCTSCVCGSITIILAHCQQVGIDWLMNPPRIPLPLLRGPTKNLLYLKNQLDKNLDEARDRGQQAERLLLAVQERYNDWLILREQLERRMYDIQNRN